MSEPLDLDAIEARASKATEGPWDVSDCEGKLSVSGVWAGIRVAQSASSRIGAIRELHAIAGIPYSAPSRRGEWSRPCNRCHRAMRQRNVNLADQPDTVRHRAAGLCDSRHRVTVGETTRSRIRPAAVAS